VRIKKLELLGFKSFKDRTVISFDEGITGIVGPNGCGKSNIVDALVWVMGEMSAKHLRGSKMEDVIFAGSQDYAPTGMAEVSLTLENDGGSFPVRYLNHSEVMVTRRLHRTQVLVQKVFLSLSKGRSVRSSRLSLLNGVLLLKKPLVSLNLKLEKKNLKESSRLLIKT